MKSLEVENLKKCVSLLKEFIDEVPAGKNKKGIAVLALEQLQKITAGTDNSEDLLSCTDRPRAEVI